VVELLDVIEVKLHLTIIFNFYLIVVLRCSLFVRFLSLLYRTEYERQDFTCG